MNWLFLIGMLIICIVAFCVGVNSEEGFVPWALFAWGLIGCFWFGGCILHNLFCGCGIV